MADIVVTVAKRSFAILPSLSPVNGSQTEEKRPWRKWSQQPSHLLGRKLGSQFQSMYFRRVMIQPGFEIESVDLRYNEVAFRRMQIAG